MLTVLMMKPTSLIPTNIPTIHTRRTNIKPIMINNNSLKIIQWNPNGFFSKLDEINLLLKKYCPISICLQETNFINNKVGS